MRNYDKFINLIVLFSYLIKKIINKYIVLNYISWFIYNTYIMIITVNRSFTNDFNNSSYFH